MSFRSARLIAAAALIGGFAAMSGARPMLAQQPSGAAQAQNDSLPDGQRLNLMHSRLDTLRRNLEDALAGLGGGKDEPKKKKGEKSTESPDDPKVRLRGLVKEVASLSNDVNDVRSKQEKGEKYDRDRVPQLEASVAELDERAQGVLRSIVRDRQATGGGDAAAAKAMTASRQKEKKGGGFLGVGKVFGGGSKNKYEELTLTVAPGRDRQLFEEARNEAHKGHYEEARYLFNVIITTYPDSAYLPAAKLAIADTFYREGTTSSLIQASQGYKDWVTFFPSDPLAPAVMIKTAEVEMRKMGLPDRNIEPARRAENILKAFLQQYPNSPQREKAEANLKEVQESLAMHNYYIGNFYYDRYRQGKANNPKGAQNRYLEIVQKYPNFSYMDEVLFRLGTTYVLEEEPDEAGKYFSQLVKYHPNSEYAEKAKEQLTTIGLPVPEADKDAKNETTPDRPGFTENLLNQILGRAAVSVDKNGVLISEDGKDDLLDKVAENGGRLPTTTPDAPTIRATQPVAPQTQPRTTTSPNKTSSVAPKTPSGGNQ